ncbi:uncharacterized protein RAG0_03148 [Rhynchosporium agropyri]|uniref:Uncharacterized protein n=2 Tax=Rhynchosporium TaxID=38037 RepID=A0A1E1MWM3_RHYSE|nr:uncharacterized protein RAG0_03148 [Rhynchosporium agropyri]CZT53447.1 uncharacterized protein RSE6_15016 [Rhynchosporium secalis]
MQVYCIPSSTGTLSSTSIVRSFLGLIDTIMSWEKVYSSHIKQVELRALNRTRGDFSGRIDLQYLSIAEVLNIPDSSWDNGSNMWYSKREETAWKLTGSCIVTSMESNMKRLL